MPALIKGLPPTPIVKPEWHEMTLVFRFDSGRVHAEDAMRYGNFAVHCAIPGEKDETLVVVTHIPTRLAVVRVTSTEDAAKIAERLWERCRDAFVEVDNVKFEKIPADVLAWIKQCVVERRYVT